MLKSNTPNNTRSSFPSSPRPAPASQRLPGRPGWLRDAALRAGPRGRRRPSLAPDALGKRGCAAGGAGGRPAGAVGVSARGWRCIPKRDTSDPRWQRVRSPLAHIARDATCRRAGPPHPLSRQRSSPTAGAPRRQRPIAVVPRRPRPLADRRPRGPPDPAKPAQPPQQLTQRRRLSSSSSRPRAARRRRHERAGRPVAKASPRPGLSAHRGTASAA
jgi:hypothetical protein